MKRMMALNILLLAIFGLMVTTSLADMVYLKNKNTIEGIVEKENASSVILNLGYGRITIDKKNIEQITRYTYQETEALKKNWGYKYFTRPEFLPEELKDLADDFNRLENLRDIAIESKNKSDENRKEIERLEKKLAAQKAEFVKVNQRLTLDKFEDNLEEYNRLVGQSNAYVAQIRLDEQTIETLQKEQVILDKKISDYINALKLFKQKFSPREIAWAKKTDKPEGIYFFEAVGKKLEEIEDDFIQHKIDYQRLGPHIVVDCWLNNLVNAHLIVDTGASLVAISSQFAEKLGLDIKQKATPIQVSLADGSKIEAKLLRLESIKVGQVEVSNVETVVLESSQVQEDGLLGMSFLEHFMVGIDGKTKQLILEEFNP